MNVTTTTQKRRLYAVPRGVDRSTLNEWLVEPVENAESCAREAQERLISLAGYLSHELSQINRELARSQRYARDAAVAADLLWPLTQTPDEAA